MNTYNAYYNGKEIELKAETAHAAQLAAVAAFHPPRSKRHMVHVVLAALGDKPVEIDGASL